MKTYHYFLIAIALAAAGCRSEEVILERSSACADIQILDGGLYPSSDLGFTIEEAYVQGDCLHATLRANVTDASVEMVAGKDVLESNPTQRGVRLLLSGESAADTTTLRVAFDITSLRDPNNDTHLLRLEGWEDEQGWYKRLSYTY